MNPDYVPDYVLVPLINSTLQAKVSPEDEYLITKFEWILIRSGYARTTKPKPLLLMHRLVLGTPPGKDTDHINRDKLDNRRSNLRVATRAQNMANTIGYKRRSKKKSSKYKGVSWCGMQKKWQAQIRVNKHSFMIGHYNDEEEAARAYDSVALYYSRGFACTNFSGGKPLSVNEIRQAKQTQTKSTTTSRYFGVSRRKQDKKWRAKITINGKTKTLGYFESEEVAARVYDKAAKDSGKIDKINFTCEEK